VTARPGAPLFVVDDDDDIRAVVMESLEEEGYRSLGAENGAEALALLRGLRELPSAILLDMMMPVMDGAAFCAELALEPRLAAIPVVIMSASARIEATARQLHASGFLAKPITLEDLFAVAQRFTESAGPALR
jgi:CheY-like chemotaxis protein